MKRFAAILLLSVATVSPDTTVFVSRISGGGGGPTLFLNETFDAAGYDNAWTESGAGYNEDYTTSPAPLSGTQSLQQNVAGTFNVNTTFAGKSTIYGAFIVNPSNIGGIPQIILWSGSAAMAEIRLRDVGTRVLQCVHGSSAAVNSTTTFALNTTLYVWFKWVKGTGANGVLEVYMSTSNTRPGTPEVNITNGNGAANTTHFYIHGTATSTAIWDNVKLSETDFPTL